MGSGAADRLVARIRLVNRRIEASALEVLALAAEEFGDGRIEITGCAHLVVYGIAETHAATFGDRVHGAGLTQTGLTQTGLVQAGLVQAGLTLDGTDSGDGSGESVSPLSALVEPVVGPVVGWFEQTDGRILLGSVTERNRLTALQARYAAAIGMPVHFTVASEILIPDLTEGVAETVVRVLAPQGFIFDASSPWAQASGSPESSAD